MSCSDFAKIAYFYRHFMSSCFVPEREMEDPLPRCFHSRLEIFGCPVYKWAWSFLVLESVCRSEITRVRLRYQG